MQRQASAFQWNAGGWFGSQIGGTCWILLAALVALPRDLTAALASFAVFLAANLVGTLMWVGRSRLRPYPAMQALLVCCGLASALATFVLDRAGHFGSLGVGGQVSAQSMYLMLAMLVPGLMLYFRSLERAGREAKS